MERSRQGPAINAALMMRLLCVLALLLPLALHAANTPCSGSKGGIDKCQGATFICRDGSVSASKKNCQAYIGGTAGGSSRDMAPAARVRGLSGAGGSGCSCRAGAYCVGPRGGHYCYTDSGGKSYLRK